MEYGLFDEKTKGYPASTSDEMCAWSNLIQNGVDRGDTRRRSLGSVRPSGGRKKRGYIGNYIDNMQFLTELGCFKVYLRLIP